MSRNRRHLVQGLLALGLLTASSACASVPDAIPTAAGPLALPHSCTEHGPVVVLVGGHGNSPAPAVTSRMTDAFAVAAEEGAPIGIVSLDGEPSLVAATAFTSDAGNDAARAEDRAQFLAGLAAAVGAVRADSPGIDLLAGLRVSADAARAGCADVGGTVLVQTAGLQDVGALDFGVPGLLGADPAEVVESLRAHGQLPDLTAQTVVLGGIGDPSQPQMPLDTARRTRLLSIWTTVVGASGADVEVDPLPRAGAALAGLPDVEEVVVPSVVALPAVCGGDTVLSDSGPLGFLPDSAVLRDPAAARPLLAQLADALASCPTRTVLLTGTTSSAGPADEVGAAGRRALSLERADAVRAALVDLGVDPGRVTTVGAGTSSPWFAPDRDGAGSLLPGPAALNRSVVVSVQTP